MPNNYKYKVRELTYNENEILVENYLYSPVFDNIEEVHKFIEKCMDLDCLCPDFTSVYIIEVVSYVKK